jgi:ABC-2 type transport system permease protein
MRNFWIVARHEFRKKISSRGFWLLTLSIPLLLGILIGVVIFLNVNGNTKTPLGVIDRAGLLDPGAWPPAEGRHIPIVPFPDEAAAQQALEAGEIQAYYILPADYLTARSLEVYYLNNKPGVLQQEDFTAFLRFSLATRAPQEAQARLADGPELIVRALDGSKEVSSHDLPQILLPFIAGMVLVISNMANAGTLLQVVADEKDNRTIEIMLTSLSPGQLIGGKVVGLMGVAFSQLAVWTAAAVMGVVLAARFVPSLQSMRIPWDYLLVVVLFFVPTFAMIAGVMTAIGGSVTDVTQGQQMAGVINMFFMLMAGVINMFFMLPLLLSAVILFNPTGPLVVVMTLFPTTAFATISLVWGYASIPIWLLATSWLLLTATALISVWASGRIFRLGMLRYGTPLDLRSALSSLRSRNE